MYTYWLPFAWGLLTLLAFLGWGAVIERLAGRPGADWGLRCGWGMAFVVVIGGLLASLSLASRPVLIALVIAGALAALPGISHKRVWTPLGILGIASLIALVYAPAVALRLHHPCDDDIAYYTFIQRLLDTGTLLEPFSLRRLSGYGGQSLLQALVSATGSEKNVMLMEFGISGVVLAGLVYGGSRRWFDRAAWPAVLAAAAAMLPIPRLNTMSQGTGLVLFLTLFRTIQLLFERELRVRDFMLTGMIGAAVCALRDNYIPAVFSAVVLSCLVRLHARTRVRNAAAAISSTLLFLSPWMLLLHRSSASWMYPLMHGNHWAMADTYSAKLAPAEAARWAIGFFAYFDVALVFIPAILFAFAAADLIVFAHIAAGMMTAAISAWLFTYTDYYNLFRYSHGFLVAALCASVFPALRAWRKGTVRLRAFAIAATTLGLIGAPIVSAGAFSFVLRVLQLPAEIRDDRPFYTPGQMEAYRRLQSHIPNGAGVLAMVGEPSLLEYRRQQIHNVDVPGASSPAPGMPYFRGPDVLKQYLRSQGIEYIAHTDFDAPQPLYYRAQWLCQADRATCGAVPATPPFCSAEGAHRGGELVRPMDTGLRISGLWTAQAPFYVDLMHNIDGLAATEEVVFCESGLRVVRLRTGGPLPVAATR